MISGDTSNVTKYVGAVEGILNALASNTAEKEVVSNVMKSLEARFMIDAIAANQSGYENISHVFEWGDQDSSGISSGRPSSQPLFQITRSNTVGNAVMSYRFLPSTQPVPLPDPARYGFSPNKIENMRRHVFRMKALVMETQSNVTVAPRYSKKLFIPSNIAKGGYVMTEKPVSINPGGPGATGGFSKFWINWFESRAPEIVREETKRTEKTIGAAGRTIIRDAAGRFASGGKIKYTTATASKARRQMLAAIKKEGLTI